MNINEVDARGQVFDGKAGTGAAFLLSSAAWKYPLDLEVKYDAQDAARQAAAQRQQAQFAHQDRLAADKQAAVELAKFQDIDLTKVAPQDQERLAQLFQERVIAPTQQAFAAGKNPMLAANAREGGALRAAKLDVVKLANASAQRNAEALEAVKIINQDSEGLYGSKADYLAKLQAWQQRPIEERATTPPPALEEFANLDKIGANIVSRQKLTIRHEAEKNGLTVTETADGGITPENRQAAVRELLAMPGVQKKLVNEYQALPENQRPASIDAYLATRAEKVIRDHEYSTHDEKIAFQQPHIESLRERRYEKDAQRNEESAMNLLTKYNQLKTSGAEQFGTPVVIGEKSYLKSDEFNNYAVGTYNGKPNQVRGILRDEQGRLYLATDASGNRPVPLTDEDAFNKFLLPAWTGANMKGKPEVLQQVARRFFVPGTNTLDTSSLGHAGTPEGERAARRAVHGNQVYVDKLHQQMVALARGIDPASGETTQIDGKPHRKAEADASAINAMLKRGNVAMNGAYLRNPVVRLTPGNATERPGLEIVHEVLNKDKELERRHLPITPAGLAELLKGYTPKAEKLDKPRQSKRPKAPGNAAPKRDILGLGMSASSSSSTGGLYTKRDILGLNPQQPAPPAYRFKPGQE